MSVFGVRFRPAPCPALHWSDGSFMSVTFTRKRRDNSSDALLPTGWTPRSQVSRQETTSRPVPPGPSWPETFTSDAIMLVPFLVAFMAEPMPLLTAGELLEVMFNLVHRDSLLSLAFSIAVAFKLAPHLMPMPADNNRTAQSLIEVHSLIAVVMRYNASNPSKVLRSRYKRTNRNNRIRWIVRLLIGKMVVATWSARNAITQIKSR